MTSKWPSNSFVATEETTTFLHEGKDMYELWTVLATETGNIMPDLLGNQLGSSFEDAVENWVDLMGELHLFDPLAMTYNGLPVVASRMEAMAIGQQYTQGALL
ncbi:MAG: hypothetical protein GY833_12085 [Aestuariibacter sp.]|nr:hypothetical protein [Aestuariibacter sp.]|tara:strand:- start:9784 stop:10092 length:309 start_codon:yes stop_codon:yes gene_type:complete